MAVTIFMIDSKCTLNTHTHNPSITHKLTTTHQKHTTTHLKMHWVQWLAHQKYYAQNNHPQFLHGFEILAYFGQVGVSAMISKHGKKLFCR
jgi:hypothetical protein